MGAAVEISRIAVLPPALADQIAAGEVVERAASVVKELCENAIDAGAHRIDVEIDGGGRRSVRVVDDGGGMTPHEARLALRRHATSKIRSADDLWGLSTFGFRGEALPSIAAVSRLTLSTKLPGAAVGFRLTVEAGVETDAREVGIPEGTQIEIRDLFFNTPARLKFQKTEATEAANVSEAVLRLALAHPDIHFRLRTAGRMVLDLPVHRKLGERVRAAFARRGAGALHEAWGEEGGHQVRAFLAAPDEASPSARSTFLFVGRRFIRDRALLNALSVGYGDVLEKGRYPLAALFLDVPGTELDVNVHPQKLEVRFARAAEVYAAVRHVVSEGVARAPWLSAARGSSRAHTLPPDDDTAISESGSRSVRLDGSSGLPARPASGWASSARAHGGGGAHDPEATLSWLNAEDPASPSSSSSSSSSSAAESLMPPYDPDSAGIFRNLVYIGQCHGMFLVCEAPGSLVLIDQHAAHELVMLDRFRRAHEGRKLRRQRLLFPVPVELGDGVPHPSRAEVEALEGLGFEVDVVASSPGQVLVRTVPEVSRQVDPKPLLQEVLLELRREHDGAGVGAGRDDQADSAPGIEAALATLARHGALRAGEVVETAQALALLAELGGLDPRDVRRRSGPPLALRIPLPSLQRPVGRG